MDEARRLVTERNSFLIRAMHGYSRTGEIPVNRGFPAMDWMTTWQGRGFVNQWVVWHNDLLLPSDLMSPSFHDNLIYLSVYPCTV